MATSVRSSKKPFGALIIILAVVGVAVLGYVVSRPTKALTLDPAAAAGIAAAGIVIGSPDAPIEVTEFADFECPACGYFATLQEPYIRERLVQTGEIRFRFLDFPLEIHRNAVAAHNAAHCANEQGKFWEMHDAIYANQERWNGQATGDPRKVLREIATSVGVDEAKWTDCYDSGRMLPQIAANRAAGDQLQVRSTPSFKIGDQLTPGALTYDQMKEAVAAEKARLAAAAPAAPPAR